MTTHDELQTTTVVSRHVTSEGILVYLRTPDGELEARLHRWNGTDGIRAGHRPSPAPCR